jgi:cobalt/nickel transport system permease protein
VSSGFSLADFLATEHGLYGRAPRGLDRWDARVKLALTAAAILSNVLLAKLGLSALLVALAWIGMAVSRIPWRQAAVFIMAPAWATLLVALGFSLGFGSEPLFRWGPLTFYREGAALALAAALRVLAEMSWIAALMLTTPFVDLLDALRWFRVPPVVVDTLGAMYRYIAVLFEEYKSMAAAAKSRGGFSSYFSALKTLGQIAAQGFLRALDRAERIDQAMRARGSRAPKAAEGKA